MTTATTTNVDSEPSQDADGSSKKSSGFRSFFNVRLLSCTIIWVFIWLCVVDLTLKTTKPLHAVKMGGYTPRDRNAMAIKNERLALPWTNPDVLTIGSSLSQASFSCADALIANRPAPTLGHEVYSYGRCDYLQSKLSEISGKKHSLLDMSIGGCMASDAYFLLVNTVKTRPAIKTVIFAVAPRDFVATDASKDPEKSPVGAFLKKKSLNLWTDNKVSPQEKFEAALASVWHFFDIKADYQHLSQLLTCQILKRNPDLYTATNIDPELLGAENRVEFLPVPISAGEVLPLDKKNKEAQIYKGFYNPFSVERMNQQFGFFEKSLEFCRQNKIAVVVIDMPLSKLNRDQMDPKMPGMYLPKLAKTCAKYGVHLVELEENKNFVDDDFRDSCHMIGTGGKKLIDIVASSISKDEALVQQLK